MNTKEFLNFLRGTVAGIMFLTIVLAALYVGKNVIWSAEPYDCLKGHEQVEQIDSYGKRGPVFVCDEVKIK